MYHIEILYFLCGAAGAFVEQIVKDNTLEAPNYKDEKIYLGFIGGVILGGIAGVIVDGQPSTAFMAGFTGTAIIENLIAQKKTKKKASKEKIPDMIRRIAIEHGVNPELAYMVAFCESGLDPQAINKNKNGTTDRGLYQINDYWHKNVSKEQAFDPEFSTTYFCKRVLQGKLSDWNASKHCWEKVKP